MSLRPFLILLAVGIGVSVQIGVRAQSDRSATQSGKPTVARTATYADEMKAAEAAFAVRHFLSARDAFTRANALRQNRSAEAWFGMARASTALKFSADSAQQLDQALKYVGANTNLEAAIRYQRGQVLMTMATGPDDARFDQAASDLQRARTLDPTLTAASYYRGVALLASYHDADGVAELKTFLAGNPTSAEAVTARDLLATPRKARERWAAPAFSIQTAEGKTLTSADLRGKVVLLDFWGTWCSPCRADTPALIALYRKFSAQPFSFISVALAEGDRDTWKAYVASHEMTWTQAVSADFDLPLAQTFHTDGVPNYIVIDADGIVRARPDNPAEIESAVRRSLATTGK